jgi:hypothetical protein
MREGIRIERERERERERKRKRKREREREREVMMMRWRPSEVASVSTGQGGHHAACLLLRKRRKWKPPPQSIHRGRMSIVCRIVDEDVCKGLDWYMMVALEEGSDDEAMS